MQPPKPCFLVRKNLMVVSDSWFPVTNPIHSCHLKKRPDRNFFQTRNNLRIFSSNVWSGGGGAQIERQDESVGDPIRGSKDRQMTVVCQLSSSLAAIRECCRCRCCWGIISSSVSRLLSLPNLSLCLLFQFVKQGSWKWALHWHILAWERSIACDSQEHDYTTSDEIEK